MATAITRTRQGPFADFTELHTRLDRLFEDLVAGGQRREWTPAIDVIRDKERIVVRADMPGIKPEDIKVHVEDDILTVSGEHEESTEHKEDDFIRRERRYGSFTRSLALPAGVDPDQIAAKSKHGVLEVTVPLPKEAKKQSVEVKAEAA